MVDLAYVIAGSEATGGAGLQADLRTFQQLGAYGVGTVTCIVSFDPKANWAHRFVPVEPQVVADPEGEVEVAGIDAAQFEVQGHAAHVTGLDGKARHAENHVFFPV